MKRILLFALLLAVLLTTCREPIDGDLDDNPDNPEQGATIIKFDNTQGICAVTVYSSYLYDNEITQIPAGEISKEFEWPPSSSMTFFFTYQINFKGISGFTINYKPELGKNQNPVRIDPNVKTTIVVPPLEEALSSPDTLLSKDSYLLIQNNSAYSLQLLRGSSVISPDNISETLVNPGERAQYTVKLDTVNSGSTANYKLAIGAATISFPASLTSFEAGRVYRFVYNNGELSLISEIELILENVAGVSPNKPVPEAPNAPVVSALDGLLTVHWTAVQGAENYEVYIGTAQEPPNQPQKTIPGTTTVFSGLTNKTAYYVWVKALNENGASDFSPRARGIPWPANEVPAAPGTPVIIPGVDQLTVNWEECGGASSYEVYINTTPSTLSAQLITSDKTSAVITYLENGIIYYLWVRAVNSTGKSGYSPVEAGTPRIPTIAPTTPSSPVLVARNRELAISWQAVELAAAYEVWVGTSNNSDSAQKYDDDITGSIMEAIITGLDNETTYYVWIKAKNVVGTSGFSLSANAKPSAFADVPETPDMPTVTSGNRVLSISWQAVEGALSYEVWTGVTSNSANAEKYGADVSGTAVTLTGLSNGTVYYIWLKAKNNIGTSGFSPIASGISSASSEPPQAPANAPVVTAGNRWLTLSWEAVEGANAYELWVGTTINPTTASKRGDDVSALSATIIGLTNDTTYYVWIKAKNSMGTSGFSPIASGTPSMFAVAPQAPAAPVIVVGNEQITVNWTAVEGARAYEIWMGTSNNSASAEKDGVDVDESTSFSRTISGLSNGTTYYVWLKAKNNVGTSGFSPAASGKPIGNAATPTLTAGNGQLSVTWTAIAGAEQYEVFYGTGVNPPQTASRTVTVASATITGLTNGTTYNVWVRGKNSNGYSTMSDSVSGKPIGNIGAVTLTSGNEQLTVSWSAVNGADEYEVYYSTSSTMPTNPLQTISTTTATIDGLSNGTTYNVWVKPRNTTGSGNVSTVNGKPLGTPGTPIVTPGYKGLLITWAAVAGADEYEVYYGIGTPTNLWTTTTATTTTITGLTSGSTYYIRLRARNSNGISEYGPDANGVSNDGPGFYRNGGAEKIGDYNLTAALSYISNNAAIGDDYLIALGADESISPANLSYSGKTVGITLLGYGGERNITLSSNGSMFTINSGVTFTLDENIKLVGRIPNNASLVQVNSGGALIMNGGSISGNYNIGGYFAEGGGVFVASDGTFTMNGGSVSENTARGDNGSYGGGVYVSGTFTMNNGSISGNHAMANNSYGNPVCGGGVFISGIFIMHGGTISGNFVQASASYDYLYGYGGGVYVNGGTFKKIPNGSLYSGIINENVVLPISRGASVYVGSNRFRNAMAGETDHIDTSTGRGLSANGYAPFGE